MSENITIRGEAVEPEEQTKDITLIIQADHKINIQSMCPDCCITVERVETNKNIKIKVFARVPNPDYEKYFKDSNVAEIPDGIPSENLVIVHEEVFDKITE